MTNCNSISIICRRLLSFFLALSIALSALFIPEPKPAYACYSWAINQRVGLRGGTQIRTGSGFSYSVHTTLPSDANNWQVDIIGGPRYLDGEEWWDISRKNIDGGGTGWVYKSQAGWDICPPPTGNIYVASSLQLSTDPSHNWPPYEGDKLNGRFTIGNNGSASVTLEGYGVRMRRNNDPNDYWDWLNISSHTLSPGQTIQFNQNNERPLSQGHYRAEVTWKQSGQDWKISDAIEFDVGPKPSGNIYVVSGLEIVTDPYHNMPPYEGDKLIGRFTLGNNGNTSVTLEGYGIRMRRNSDPNDYWDWLTTNSRSLEPGQTIRFDQNNEKPLTLGHYRAEITWKQAGQDWKVLQGTEFDVVKRTGGSVSIVSGLELISDPSKTWPPQDGEKLVGRFTMENSGTELLTLERYGVRMRRNNDQNDYWDWLSNSSISLQPGQKVSFDQNNERPLALGHYRADITWKQPGGNWEVSHATEFDVVQKNSQGKVLVETSLQLLPDPDNGWPPQEGQKLIGRFSLKNIGGADLQLESYGVRLRRNGTDNWDFLNTVGTVLSPGESVRFEQNNERNLSSGNYEAQVTWKVYGGNWQAWGLRTFYVGDVVVPPTLPPDQSPIQSTELSLIEPISLDPQDIYANESVIGSFTVKNSSNSTLHFNRIGIGGRGPLGTDIYDFPWYWNGEIAPGETLNFEGIRQFTRNGRYTFFPVYETSDGVWHEVLASDGLRAISSITVHNQPDSIGNLFMLVNHVGDSNQVIDISQGKVTQNSDGTYRISNIRIENRSMLCRQFRMTNNGQNMIDHSWEWAVFSPYQVIDSLTLSSIPTNSNIEIVTNRMGDTPESAFIVGICNLAAFSIAAVTGDYYRASDENGIEFFGALNDQLWEVANKAGIPIVEVEALLGDLLAGRVLPAIRKIISINARYPDAIPTILESGFLRRITHSALSESLEKAAQGIERLLNIGRSGILLWNWMFEKPVESHSSFWVEGMEKTILFQAAQARNAIEETKADPGNWAAVQNGGTIIQTSHQLALAEQNRIIDGSYVYGWVAQMEKLSPPATIIRLASGRPVSIDRVIIHPGPMVGLPASSTIASFRIDFSLDGENFNNVVDGAIGSSEVGLPVEINFDGIMAEYVRIELTENQDPNSPLIGLAELEVYGTPGLRGDMFEPDGSKELANETNTVNGAQGEHHFHYPGDEDWVRFEVKAGKTYRITAIVLGSDADTVLELYSSDGSTLLEQNDDWQGYPSSTIFWTASENGVYFIRVRNLYSEIYGQNTEYRVSVQEVHENQLYLPLVSNQIFRNSPPLGPLNVQTIGINSTSILLTWEDQANDESGYIIQSMSGEEIKLPANTTRYLLENLQPGIEYCFTIQAMNSWGMSDQGRSTCSYTKSHPGIFGKVTYAGKPVGDIHLVLRLYNGLKFIDFESTTTDENGVYSFENIPTLGEGEFYYVIYQNGYYGNALDYRFLWVWWSYNIIHYISGNDEPGGDFDILNVALKSPDNFTMHTLPVNFTWRLRSMIPTDTYSLRLFNIDDPSLQQWETYPPLGYTWNFSLESLPASFMPGVTYGWELWISDTQGGIGTSLHYREIQFSDSVSSQYLAPAGDSIRSLADLQDLDNLILTRKVGELNKAH